MSIELINSHHQDLLAESALLIDKIRLYMQTFINLPLRMLDASG
jgi:hypothetical protein